MKKILVATIGTRDLMFQVSSGEWFNLGDDQIKNDIITEHTEVIGDLALPDLTTHRELTEYLFQNIDQYISRLKPVIFGKIFQEKNQEIQKVYLIGTDQKIGIEERVKDTIYSSEIIQAWLNHNFPQINTEIIPLGHDGENPSDFEAMFRWWVNIWKTKIILDENQKLWVCLKGGVGQTSEASRISGLNIYEENIEFFEFEKTPRKNKQGIPSSYYGPFLGTNYLWSRIQKQALELLDNYSYQAVQDLLNPYFVQNSSGWSSTPNLLRGAIAWNQGSFDQFVKYVQSDLDKAQRHQSKTYWWQAYEQAYTAVIRLKQGNTTEAMQHSFRAIEGLLYEWNLHILGKDFIDQDYGYLKLNKNILHRYPELQSCFQKFDYKNTGKVEIRGELQATLIRVLQPKTFDQKDFSAWNSKNASEVRNYISHRLGGISERELFSAWGHDIKNLKQWEQRILNCINQIIEKQFSSFTNASLLPVIHFKIKQSIAQYSP